MNSYKGLHAALYDEIYEDKPYAAEAQFVHDLAGSPGGRLLDVACGTGRHALAFAALGYDVTAADINEELLAVARAAAKDGVRFVAGDMRDLNLGTSTFDVVTCLFDSIGYALDNDGVVAALRSLGRHTAPGGHVVCEFLHAPALLTRASPVRVRRRRMRDGRTLLRVAETTLDVERMLLHVEYELLVLGEDGLVNRMRETHVNRFFAVPEIHLLAAVAGLETHAVVPAYRDGGIDADTFHVLLIATPPA